MESHLFDNLLVFFILGTLFVMVYCKVTKKTLLEFIREIREAFADEVEQ